MKYSIKLTISLILLYISMSEQAINWQIGDWALGCDFRGNDLANQLTTGENCGSLCAATTGCTHFTWTNHLGGTCWMKQGPVSKNDAFETFDNTMVCGIINGGTGGGTVTVNPTVPSVSNGVFPGCQFKGGRYYDGNVQNYANTDHVSIWLGSPSPEYGTDFNPWYHGLMIDACKQYNKVPVFYAYIIAFESRYQIGLDDCNVDPYWNYCHFGAKYIRDNRQRLVDRYNHQAFKIAERLGRNGVAIFLIEPDFWQYYGDYTQEGGPNSGEYMRNLFNDFVRVIKNNLPNALISFDISAWIGENGFRTWWNFFKDSQIDFIHTSGGEAVGDSSNIKPGELSWRFVSQTTGKKIIADCGYAVAGAAYSNCGVWMNANNVNNRIADGVVALTQGSNYQPMSYKPNLC